MLTSTIRNRLILYFVLFSFIACYGQGSGLTEEDVIRKAQTHFDQKEYKEAMPLFAQLVSIHPSNPEYNYKFGVCALFGDRSDRRRPIRYLNNALKTMGDDPGLSYHLGLAYYQNQEFSNAMRFFNLYLGKLGPDSRERPPILEKINACLNGLNLEHTNVIDEIISKSEFKTDNFHRAYRADDFNGMLVLKPENFVTPYEKKTGQNSFVFISEPRDVLYFSGYEANSTQKDIFRVTLNEKGDWGKPEKLPDVVNTNYDEDYPVVVDDGKTLYFSSKGHNSVGGYDLFKTTLNPETNSFSTPENLGVGVNSPFDDFLFIPDKTGNFAWFASDRENLNGSLSVYKIRLNDKYAHQDKLMAVNTTPNITDQTEKTDVVFEAPAKATSEQTTPLQTARASQTEMTPAERAARLKTERDMVNKLADTSYMLVTQTRNLIRDIGNKRDRANSVTENKREAVKTLEVKFEALTTSMVNITSGVEFERQLENAINLKREIYQYRMRADEANLIAWNLGKQLRVKNEEFEKLKTSAGNVQTNSMSGKVEDTRIAFLELKSVFNVSDTLTDYTNQLMSISSDEKTYEVPEAELAFAADLRKGFETNTLLAQTKKPEAIQRNEDIPIVVVDKRTQPGTVKQPEKRYVTPSRQVEQVVLESESVALNVADYEQPVIRFEIDAIQPAKQVIPVRYEPLAFNPGYPENDLVVDLKFGFPDAYPQVEQVFVNATTQYPEWDDNIEINLAADIIEPLALVMEVAPEDYTFNMVEEMPVINHSVDAVQPEPVIAQIEYDAGNNNMELHDEELNLALQTEALKILELVKQVNFDENAYALAVIVEDGVDIALEEKRIKAYEIIQPIDVNLFAYNLPIGESDIHIDIEPEMIKHNDASPIAQVIEIPDRLKKGLAFGIEESIIVLEENEVDLIALTRQIIPPLMTGLILDEEDIVLSVESEKFHKIPLVSPIEMNPLAYNGIRLHEENVDVRIEVGAFIKIVAIDLVDPIIIPEFPDALYSYFSEEAEVRIEDASVEELIVARQVEPVTLALKEIIMPYNDNDFIEINFLYDLPEYSDEVIAQFSGISATVINPDSTNNNKNINADILYLRESVSLANDIETTRSDAELISMALTAPDNLEYEELLYAASLATNPKDKIMIYNSAFIHIDRDWRAFNNAGVTSLGIKDLDQAECLLYQASLISDNNGKILNNMGILACLKNDYRAAGDHFIAASQMGVNAEYNMQVLNNMVNGAQFNTDQLRKEIGEHRYKLDLRKR